MGWKTRSGGNTAAGGTRPALAEKNGFRSCRMTLIVAMGGLFCGWQNCDAANFEHYYYNKEIIKVMAHRPNGFDFKYFDELNVPNDQKVAEADLYLSRHYPPGSDAAIGVRDMEQAGASCQRVNDRGELNDRGEFYWCRYTIHHFFNVEWQVAFKLIPGTNAISKVSSGRAIDGF